MNARQRQHYLQLWELADSLQKDWWQNQEKDSLFKTLRDAVTGDANLADEVNINAPDFLAQLSNQLQILVVSRPELSQGNLPPAGTLKAVAQHQTKFHYRSEETDFTFRHGKKGGPNLSDSELQAIFAKHGLIDGEGDFVKRASEVLRGETSREISQRSTALQHRRQLEYQISRLFENQVPAALFRHELFGYGPVPGIAPYLADKISQKSTDYLFQRLRVNQGGRFDVYAPDFQKALNRAVSETQDHIASHRLFDRQETTEIGRQIDRIITSSPQYQLLTAENKQLLSSKLMETIASLSSSLQTPTQINSFQILQGAFHRQPVLKKTEAGYQDSHRHEQAYRGQPNKPRNLVSDTLQEAQKGLDINSADAAVINTSRFVDDFKRDPFGALMRYPYFSLVYLLPKPITNLLYPSRDSFRARVKKYYGLSISSDAQRQLIENFGKNLLKGLGRKFGLYTRDSKGDYHFILTSAVAWASDKAFTGLGEGIGRLFGFIPGIGGTLRESISRSVGQKRDKKKSLLAAWFVSLPIAIIKLLPKALWALAKTNPAISQAWINFRFLVESKLPVLKFLRIGGGISKAFLKAIPHGLVSGLGGSLITGNPAWGIGLGSGDFIIHFLRNLNRIPEISHWATGPHASLFGKIFGTTINSRFVYLPAKGGLLGWWAAQYLLPGWGIWGRIVSAVGGAGLEYGVQTTIVPFITRHLAPPIAKFFGLIGRFFNFLVQFVFNPGSLLGLQLAPLLGLSLNPILTGVVGFLGGGAIYWTATKLIFGHFIGLGGWLGYGAGTLISTLLNLTGIPSFLIHLGTTSLGVYLHFFGIKLTLDWLLASTTSALNAALTGTATAAAGITAGAVAALAIAITVLTAGTIWVVITFASVFVEEKALSSEFVSSNIPIKKALVSAEKNGAGEIMFLNYELTYSLSSTVNGTLEDIQIRDRFKHTGKLATYIFPLLENFWFSGQILTLGNNEPSSFEPCDPKVIENYFLWYHKPPPEISPDDHGLCPEEFGPLSPGEKRTITMRLSLKKPLNKILTKENDSLCNTFGISGKITGQENREFSSISLCVNNEGKVSTEAAAELARAIVNSLHGCGLSAVNAGNLNSVNNCLTAAGIPPAAIEKIISSASPKNYGKLQCASFVIAVENTTGGSLPSYYSARDYWRKLTGYHQISKDNYLNIMPGDMLVWNSDGANHMAMAVETTYDGSRLIKITIAEALGDSKNNGKVRFREIPVTNDGLATTGLAGWQRRNN